MSASSCRSGARRVGSGNHVRVVGCGDHGHIPLDGEHPSKQTLPGLAPSTVKVTISHDPPFKMSDRHVVGKRPNRKRQVAPRAVSHLHLVQADVIVDELTAATQPAPPYVDKVRIRREQLTRALHVVLVPGALPTVGQHCRSALESGGFEGMRHVRHHSLSSAVSISADPTAR